MNSSRAPALALVVLATLLTACFCGPTPPTPQPVPTENDLGVTGSPLWPDGILQLGLAPSGGSFEFFGPTFQFDHGPQGGIHVPIAWRVNDREYDARFVLRVRRISDGLLVYQTETQASGSSPFDAGVEDAGATDAGSSGGGFTTSGGLRAFLCPVKGIDLKNVPISFELTVIGGDKAFLGRVTVTSKTAEPDCTP